MWCAGLAILLAAPLLGQQQPVIRSTSQEVLLDVIVRDKKGRPVRDLKAGEIQVREEGQVQTIRAFRLVDRKGAAAVEEGAAATAPGAPSAASPKTPNFARDIRLVSLVFERLGVDGRRLAKSAALDVLETEKDSNVLFSVFRIDHNLRVVQRFTNDHEALKKAVERAVGGTFSDFAHDLDAANHAVDTTNGSAGTSDQTAQNQGPTGPTQPVNSAGLANEQIGQMMLDMQQFDEMLSSEQQGRESIFPLLAIVKDQQKLPGRKTVLYFSEGLHIPNSLVEQFHSVIGAANRASVSVYAIDARGLLSASQNQPSISMLQGALASSARQQRSRRGESNPITRDEIMALDRGLDSIRANTQTTLAELAEGTGGFLIANTNDLRVPLQKLTEDLESYYEVTYTPRIDAYDGRFRKIAVTVTRPDVKVQTRSGYYALPPDDNRAVFPYEVPLLNALGATPLPRGFEFHAAALRFRSVARGTQFGLVIQLPLSGITFAQNKEEKTYLTHLSLLTLVKNQAGGVVKRLTRDVPFQGPLDKMEAFQRGTFTLTEYFELPPGRYTLETAIVDREGQRVSARKTVLVVGTAGPGLDMSSMALVRRLDPDKEAADAADPFRFEGGKITPSLIGSVPGGKGASIAMYFVVYPNAEATETPQLTLEVLEDGKPLVRVSPQLPAPDAQGRVPYVASTSAEALKPGQYEIRAVVRQGANAREEHAFFTVE